MTHIFITKVHPGTDADKAGLQEGDEIVKLDGEPVKGLDPRIVKDSPLGRILLNRTPGEALNLEVITHRKQELTLHAQRELPPYARLPDWQPRSFSFLIPATTARPAHANCKGLKKGQARKWLQ